MAGSKKTMMDFFKQLDTDKALSNSNVACAVTEGCQYRIRYTARLMRGHLEREHRTNEAVSTPLALRKAEESRKRERASGAQQAALPVHFGTAVSSITPEEKEGLSFLIAKTIVTDGMAFNSFYRTALAELVHTIVPAYRIPTPPTLANKYIPMVADTVG